MRCMSAPQELPTLVEFDFALQGERYRFRRSQFTHVKRNTKLPELRESHECFQQIDGDWKLLESGSESAVRRRAEELLHLTCEQFSQVIVLPQGDFLRLLRANSKDKGEMLKTLFSAGVWREVADRFHQRERTLEDQGKQSTALRASLLQKEGCDTTQALEEKAAALAQGEERLRAQSAAGAKELEQAEAVLKEHSEALSAARKQFAGELVEKIADGLRELNFLDVQFEMEFRRLDHFTAGGIDEPEFLISTNPGEPVRPLGMVASGGELSRIMLAIKTVLAETDQVPTLIFDEIDTGISGRTAQMVSEKLRILSKCRQVICITHLPQIAAMADQHFEIRKSASDGRTATSIRALDREAMVDELARLLGGAEITETVRQNAEEMKKLAKKRKLEV